MNGDNGSDIIVVRADAVGDGGSGDDILIAADNTVASGGEGDDWLIGLDHAVLNGGAGDDWILHFGSGEANGGDGSDTLVAIAPDILSPDDVLEMRGGDGDDWVMAFGGDGVKIYGGAGSDWVVGWSGQDRLWGGDGTPIGDGKYADDGATDYFNISGNSIVMDAQADDYVELGPTEANGRRPAMVEREQLGLLGPHEQPGLHIWMAGTVGRLCAERNVNDYRCAIHAYGALWAGHKRPAPDPDAAWQGRAGSCQ